ncbi:siderophore ABC transporter substrate-binding protein [Diaphorobacter caeni]|uniref:siderophore ABC transporter substrate-binding protein n=1 Tax=Diaphorobacter caeni TaxID=2784387 RepID=UPI00188E9298|nr:ABC transporter substrate-binding protein [Diaphorobacter caeni]MBF5003045.1 ABC transporter substrate-binding protein [Diaphorobacter caeni]
MSPLSTPPQLTRRTALAFAVALGTATFHGLTLARSSTGTTGTVDVRHARGNARVAANPQRVVAYDLASLDIMQSLQLPVAGVPRAAFPQYLQGFGDHARYPIAGSLFDPDFDALSRIRPDLILVGGRSAARSETLARIAPTLDMSTRGTQLLEDMGRNVQALASLYGKQAQGEQLMKQVHDDIAELKPITAKAGRGLLVLAINDKLSPQAPGTRFGLLHDVLGVQPALAADKVPARGQPFTMDDIARIDPDWLYVIDRNAATGSAAGGGVAIASEKVFDNATIRATTAGKRGQVVFLDPKGWYLMGSAAPTAMIQNVRQIRGALTANSAASAA